MTTAAPTPNRVIRALGNGWIVVLIFTAITIGMTWPLVTVLPTRIAADVGDPVFACWVMMWTGGQVLRFLSGDVHALADFWNGNIFFPERMTIAYAEHLTPQMLQILPLFAVTNNIVLCYNLLFLSTIVLSAVGMYLFVRELTGQPLAAVVAGAAFAFSPYRADQYPHIQVLSTQWMPLALYGFQRYFANGRWRALMGAAGAVVLQGLSCGYYLFFFTPFAVVFAILEGARRGAWRKRRTWMQVGITAAVSLAVIAAFARPYFAARALNPEVGVRNPEEIRAFAADTWSLATASDALAVWGGLQAYPRPEGSGFPGLTILLIGLAGVVAAVLAAAAYARAALPARDLPQKRGLRTAIAAVLVLSAALVAAGWIWLLIFHAVVIREWWGRITVRGIRDIAGETALILGIALALYPRFRRAALRFVSSAEGFLVLAWIAAVFLSFGRQILVHGHPIGAGPYKWFADFVPGFDGLRVPSRYFMVASLFLAALGGVGAAAVLRRSQRAGVILSALLVAGILAEGRVATFYLSKPLETIEYNEIRTDLPTPANWGAVYDAVQALPDSAVLAEFPFGSGPYEMRTMYFAGYHRKRVINGFSGFFPMSYQRRRGFLEKYPADLDAAWRELMNAGVTHVIVHEQAYRHTTGEAISDWIRKSGGRDIASYYPPGNGSGSDHLFAIR